MILCSSAEEEQTDRGRSIAFTGYTPPGCFKGVMSLVHARRSFLSEGADAAQTVGLPGTLDLFDHPVRPLEKRRRDRQAERLGGLEVDGEVELGGLLNREISGLGAPEYLVHMRRGTPNHLGLVGPVGHEPACLHVPRKNANIVGRRLVIARSASLAR